MNDKQDSRLME